MQHNHTSPAPKEEGKLFFVMCLTGIIMLVEVVGGYVAGSLALLADAGHMFTDVAALLLAWLATRYGRKAPDDQRSFGYQRLKILAAYTNGILLLFLTAVIVVEAIKRLAEPEPIQSTLMLIVAVVGFVTNLLSLAVLGGHHHHEHGHEGCGHDHEKKPNLNIQTASLHVMSDLLGSVGAIAAAGIIYFTGFVAADAILSIVVSLLILVHAIKLVRKTTHILIEGTPDPELAEKIKTALLGVPGVKDVHHIHIWSLTENQPLATLEVLAEESVDAQALLHAIHKLLHDKFGLDHVTVQIEKGPCPGFDF